MSPRNSVCDAPASLPDAARKTPGTIRRCPFRSRTRRGASTRAAAGRRGLHDRPKHGGPGDPAEAGAAGGGGQRRAAGRLTGRGRPAAVRQLDCSGLPASRETRGWCGPGAGLVRAWCGPLSQGRRRWFQSILRWQQDCPFNPALATGLPPLGRRAGRLRRARLGAPSGRPGHAPASSCHSSSCCDLGRCREDRHTMPRRQAGQSA